MNMLHRWDGDRFLPVMESSTTAEILTSRPWAGLESVRLRPGKWTRTFFHAEEVSDKRPPRQAARRSGAPTAARTAADGDFARPARHAAWSNAISPSPTWWKSGSA